MNMMHHRLLSILDSVMNVIDEDTQWDDVGEIMDEVEHLVNSIGDKEIKLAFDKIFNEAYACKGNMYDVVPMIYQMRQIVFSYINHV